MDFPLRALLGSYGDPKAMSLHLVLCIRWQRHEKARKAAPEATLRAFDRLGLTAVLVNSR